MDVSQQINFHKEHGKLATVTAVQPPGRYGALAIENRKVKSFQEKPFGDGGWINGGFFVLEPSVIDLIETDSTVWERSPLDSLAKSGELSVYKHTGFWQPMDTLREKTLLEDLWAADKAPWKIWR